jgi:hypothetical protein
MKVIMLMTGGGPLVILTSYDEVTEVGLLKKLETKGIDKFVAHEIPLDLAKERYGTHFSVVANDLRESDDLRVLDYNGDRAFKLFSFDELGPPITYEAGGAPAPPPEAEVRAAEDLQ